MAVYERGYRTYRGGFSGAPAWYVIYREGYGLAFRSKGLRVLAVLFLIWFVIWGGVLYATIGVADVAERATGGSRGGFQSAAHQLKQTLSVFYGGLSILTGLLAILIGAGLISGDLRTRALPLYLVRPIRAWEYVLGKALVLPRVLLWTCLLPGFIYYLLVGLWQPPGETLDWLTANLDIVAGMIEHYLIAATSYTGLMLFLSARTDRGSAVVSFAAAVLFAGSLLYGILSRLEGVGAVMKYASLPLNTVSPFVRSATEAALEGSMRTRRRAHLEDVLEWTPTTTIALIVGVVLLGLGMWSALRRASTVEVSA